MSNSIDNFQKVVGFGTNLAVPIEGIANGTSVGVAIASSVTVSVNLAQVGGAAIALGQTTMANSLPVTIASNQSNIPVNLAQVNGATISLGQTTMASSLPVTIASNQSNIPVNLAQVGGAAIALGQTTMAASVPVTIASNQSVIGTNVSQWGGAATTLGQKVMASSVPVTIASDQTNIPVNLAQVGGTNVTLGQKVMASSVPVTIASDQSVLGINVSQWGGTATTLGQKVMASSVPVVIASDQSTVPINNAQWGGAATTLGQKVMASSVPVVIASDQSPVDHRLTRSKLATYTVLASGPSIATATDHLLSLQGGGAAIDIWGVKIVQANPATTITVGTFQLVRLSAVAASGGTTPAVNPLDPADGAFTGNAKVIPTTKGTVGAILDQWRMTVHAAITANDDEPQGLSNVPWTMFTKPYRYDGTVSTNGLAISNVTAVAGASVDVLFLITVGAA